MLFDCGLASQELSISWSIDYASPLHGLASYKYQQDYLPIWLMLWAIRASPIAMT